MLQALQQLNSEPVVVLQKLGNKYEKHFEKLSPKKNVKKNDLKTNSYRITLPTTSTREELKKSNLRGVDHHESNFVKRKVSLEDALNEANAAYFKSAKKIKTDTSNKKEFDEASGKLKNTQFVEPLPKCKTSQHSSKAVEGDSIYVKKKKKKAKSHKSKEKHSETPSATCEKHLVDSEVVYGQETLLNYLELMPKPSSHIPSDSDSTNCASRVRSPSNTILLSDLPRSDSVETVALDVDSQEESNVLVECVDLISPVNSPEGMENSQHRSELATADQIVTLAQSSVSLFDQEFIKPETEKKSLQTPNSSSFKKQQHVERFALTGSTSEASNSEKFERIQQLELASTLSSGNPQHTFGHSVLPNNGSDPKSKDADSLVTMSINSDKTGHISNLQEDKALDAVEEPHTPLLGETLGSLNNQCIVSTISCVTNKQAVSSDNSQILTETINPTLLESKKQILSREMESLKALFKTASIELKALGNDLRSTAMKQRQLKTNLETKKSVIDADAKLVLSLTNTFKHLEAEHGRLSLEKKKAHQTVLETEIQLRELQVELCKEQLQFGTDDSRIRETQKKVDKLAQDVLQKSSELNAVSETFKQSDIRFKQIQSELDVVIKRQSERQTIYDKDIASLQSHSILIREKMESAKRLVEKRKNFTLKLLDLEQQLVQIKSLQRINEISKQRQQILAIDYSQSFSNYMKSIFGEQPSSSPPEILSAQKQLTVLNSSTVDDSVNHTLKTNTAILPSNNQNRASAQTPITLNSLAEAVPFYANFLNGSKITKTVSNNEKELSKDIIQGCRQYMSWKTTYLKSLFSIDSLDEKSVQQHAAYVKEFVIPLFQLWTMKNSDLSSLLDCIILNGQSANWYGFPNLDPISMRLSLETNINEAIEISRKFTNKTSDNATPTARIEFRALAEGSSLPVFSIVPKTTVEHVRGPKLIELRRLLEQPKQSTECNEQSSTALQTTVAQNPNIPLFPDPMNAESTTASLVTESNQTTAHQVWPKQQLSSEILTFQSTVVQNTAVVVPMTSGQYPSRPAMPNVASSSAPSQQLLNRANPASRATTQSHQNSIGTSNQTRFPLSAFQSMKTVQYPQRSNQYIPANYSYAQRAAYQQQYSQQLTSKQTNPVSSGTLQPYPIIRNQLSSSMPVIQQQSLQTVQFQRPHSAHPNSQIIQQHGYIMVPASAVSVQNSQLINLPSTQQQQGVIPRVNQENPIPQAHSKLKPMTFTCLNCPREAHKKCSRCLTAHYCSGECQLAHWDEHRKTCAKQ